MKTVQQMVKNCEIMKQQMETKHEYGWGGILDSSCIQCHRVYLRKLQEESFITGVYGY